MRRKKVIARGAELSIIDTHSLVKREDLFEASAFVRRWYVNNQVQFLPHRVHSQMEGMGQREQKDRMSIL